MRRGQNSDLNQWLREFDSEPERKDENPIIRFYRHEASTVAQGLRDKYKQAGHNLLDPRPWGTKEGGGSARMVMSPDMTVYQSVRQAAVDEGVNPCTITRLCNRDGSGWDYLS
jgi:hypothetical protein